MPLEIERKPDSEEINRVIRALEDLEDVLPHPAILMEYPIRAFGLGKRNDGSWSPQLVRRGEVFIVLKEDESSEEVKFVLWDSENEKASLLFWDGIEAAFSDALNWCSEHPGDKKIRFLFVEDMPPFFWAPGNDDESFFPMDGGRIRGGGFTALLGAMK
jgi:hypothetical protein